MKKALSLLLAFSMAATISLAAFAEDADIFMSASGNDISEEAVLDETVSDAATGETAEAAELLDVPEDWVPALSDEDMAAIEAAVQNGANDAAEASDIAIDEDTFGFLAQSYTNDVYGFVRRMYNVILNRDPDSVGLAYWTTPLLNGTKNGADVVYGFLTSNEYVNAGLTDAQKVTIAYSAILGRNPDTAGYQYWMEGLAAGMSTVGIANGFCQSTEFQNLCASYRITAGSIPTNLVEGRDRNLGFTRFVSRLYTNCLGRGYDVNGLNYWCLQLVNGTADGASVAGQFVFSKEYTGKHVSNTDFCVMLYSTFLDRAPEYNGLIYWVTKLNNTQSRAFVMNEFMASTEFKTICGKAGVSISGRYAEPDGTESWKMNVKLLQLINSQRIQNGVASLILNDDVYSVAEIRAKELPVRSAEIVKEGGKVGDVDEYRPNSKGDYLDVYAEVGVDCNYKYELRASAPSTATPAEIVTALMKNTTYKRTILNSKCTNFGGSFVFQSSRGWYTFEIAG